MDDRLKEQIKYCTLNHEDRRAWNELGVALVTQNYHCKYWLEVISRIQKQSSELEITIDLVFDRLDKLIKSGDFRLYKINMFLLGLGLEDKETFPLKLLEYA